MINDNIIELTGEEGDILRAEYLDTVEMDGNEYVVLTPVDDEDDICGCEKHQDKDVYGCEEIEVIIMRIEKNGDEEFLIPIKDDCELEKVFIIFQKQFMFDDDEED